MDKTVHRPIKAIICLNPLKVLEYCLCDDCKDKVSIPVTIEVPEGIGPQLDDTYIAWINENVPQVKEDYPSDNWWDEEDCW